MVERSPSPLSRRKRGGSSSALNSTGLPSTASQMIGESNVSTASWDPRSRQKQGVYDEMYGHATHGKYMLSQANEDMKREKKGQKSSVSEDKGCLLHPLHASKGLPSSPTRFTAAPSQDAGRIKINILPPSRNYTDPLQDKPLGIGGGEDCCVDLQDGRRGGDTRAPADHRTPPEPTAPPNPRATTDPRAHPESRPPTDPPPLTHTHPSPLTHTSLVQPFSMRLASFSPGDLVDEKPSKEPHLSPNNEKDSPPFIPSFIPSPAEGEGSVRDMRPSKFNSFQQRSNPLKKFHNTVSRRTSQGSDEEKRRKSKKEIVSEREAGHGFDSQFVSRTPTINEAALRGSTFFPPLPALASLGDESAIRNSTSQSEDNTCSPLNYPTQQPASKFFTLHRQNDTRVPTSQGDLQLVERAGGLPFGGGEAHSLSSKLGMNIQGKFHSMSDGEGDVCAPRKVQGKTSRTHTLLTDEEASRSSAFRQSFAFGERLSANRHLQPPKPESKGSSLYLQAFSGGWDKEGSGCRSPNQGGGGYPLVSPLLSPSYFGANHKYGSKLTTRHFDELTHASIADYHESVFSRDSMEEDRRDFLNTYNALRELMEESKYRLISFLRLSMLISVCVSLLKLGASTLYDPFERTTLTFAMFIGEIILTCYFVIEVALMFIAPKLLGPSILIPIELALVLTSIAYTSLQGYVVYNSYILRERSIELWLLTLLSIQLLRSYRLIMLTPKFKMLLKSVFHSLSSLRWTVLFVLLVVYACGVFTKYAYGNQKRVMGDEDEVAILGTYWGTLPSSMFTLFTILTLEGWNDIAMATAEVFPYSKIFFVIFICFATITMMNVVMGIIFDTYLEMSKQLQAENSYIDELTKSREIFGRLLHSLKSRAASSQFLHTSLTEETERELLDSAAYTRGYTLDSLKMSGDAVEPLEMQLRGGKNGYNQGGNKEFWEAIDYSKEDPKILLRGVDPQEIVCDPKMRLALQAAEIPLFQAFEVLYVYQEAGVKEVSVSEFASACSGIFGTVSRRHLLAMNLSLREQMGAINRKCNKLGKELRACNQMLTSITHKVCEKSSSSRWH